jgi:hypothetical protein
MGTLRCTGFWLQCFRVSDLCPQTTRHRETCPPWCRVSDGGVGIGTGGEHLASTSVLDVGGMAGRVATAASATVSGVVGMIGGGGGLSLHGSAMKLQWYVILFFFLN